MLDDDSAIPYRLCLRPLHSIPGLGIALGVSFHSLMVLLTHQTFGPFYAAIALSFLAFMAWPTGLVAPRRGMGALVARFATILVVDRAASGATLATSGE